MALRKYFKRKSDELESDKSHQQAHKVRQLHYLPIKFMKSLRERNSMLKYCNFKSKKETLQGKTILQEGLGNKISMGVLQ